MKGSRLWRSGGELRESWPSIAVLVLFALIIVTLAVIVAQQQYRERELLLESIRTSGWIAHNVVLEHMRAQHAVERASTPHVTVRDLYLRLSLLVSRLREIQTSGEARHIRKVFAEQDRLSAFEDTLSWHLDLMRQGEAPKLEALSDLLMEMAEPIRMLSQRTLAFNEVVYGRDEELMQRPPVVPLLVAGGIIVVALLLFGFGMRAERRRRQAAIELERGKATAEEDVQSMAALAPPMFIVDAENRIVFASNLAEVFVESLPEDDSRALTDLIADGARRVKAGMGGRAASQSFLPSTGPSDGPWAVEVQFSQVEWHGAPAVMALLVEETWIRDEFRRYTERIAQSRVTSAVRELAHELKQPIWLIDLATKNLMRRATPETGRAIEEPISKIQRGVERMNSIINAFRDKEDEDEKDVSFNLRTAIDASLSLASGMLRQHGVELRYTPGPAAELSTIGSQTLFEQALLNLVSNACEAHASDRRSAQQRRVDVRVVQGGETARICVSDNAGGLDETIEDPFAPGITTKGGHDAVRGIGLSFTRKVVEEMGGCIGFKNVPGHGVMFTVEVPVAHARRDGEEVPVPSGDRQVPC